MYTSLHFLVWVKDLRITIEICRQLYMLTAERSRGQKYGERTVKSHVSCFFFSECQSLNNTVSTTVLMVLVGSGITRRLI